MNTTPGRTLVIRGDAASLPLPDGSVDLIVTSPPFFALREYTDGGKHYAGQLGSEPTPAEYIAALVTCTREWVRVLKPDGIHFVELGDKYATAYTAPTTGRQSSVNVAPGSGTNMAARRAPSSTASKGMPREVAAGPAVEVRPGLHG